MTSLTISLPEPLKDFVEEQVQTGNYPTASDYLGALVKDAQRRKAQEQLEKLLLDGLNSPTSEMTSEDWAEIRQEVRDRLSAQSKSV